MSDLVFTMVDLETYSRIPTAAIASIGAVKFDPLSRKLLDEFYCTIDPMTCKEHDLHFHKDTLKWWKNRPMEVRQALRENNIPLVDALTQFAKWYRPTTKVLCWRMFDIPVLDHAYYKIGMDSPWNYWDTIECSSIATFLDEKIDRSSSTHHNALEDAKIQAKFMINLFNPEENNA